ncbi:MAG: substrate-binding domain-containing protein, partial [Aeromicrobium sp.]
MTQLLDTGRRTIATISGPQAMASGRDRREGYGAAVEAAGLVLDDGLVVEGDFSEQSGWAGMEELLTRRPDIDGVFAASDLMATGAMRSLRTRGRRVPDDVAVIGFVGTTASETTEPPLSTVCQCASLWSISGAGWPRCSCATSTPTSMESSTSYCRSRSRSCSGGAACATPTDAAGGARTRRVAEASNTCSVRVVHRLDVR